MALFATMPAFAQQDVGHKAPGTLGIEAGRQPEPGVYLVDRLLYFSARTLRDRNGAELPVGLEFDAVVNGFGVVGVLEVPVIGGFLTVAMSFPVAHLSVNTTLPEASIDRLGIGDLYVQPLRLGWKTGRADIVGGYGLYVPTGRFQPRGSGGIGQGHWTQQISTGGSVALDRGHVWRVSALASLDLNGKKRGVDLRRGATVQVQGGLGWSILPVLEVGLAGYALWQVTDDSGTALPPVLRGARDRVLGLGPQVDVSIPPLRSRLTLRYAHDFGVESRPQGRLLVVGITFAP